MSVAAAGFAYLFGDGAPPAGGGLEVRVLLETENTVTLGWDPVPDAAGYRFSSELSTGRPHTWDPMFQRDKTLPACNTRFAKGSTWYMVEALSVVAMGVYPPPLEGQSRGRIGFASLTIGDI